MPVRAVLRDRLQPGERALGWSWATLGPSLPWALTAIGAQVIPGAGFPLLVWLRAAARVLVVTTDRRVLILSLSRVGRAATGGGGAAARGVLLEAPLHRVEVRRLTTSPSPRRFVVRETVSKHARGGAGRTIVLEPVRRTRAEALRMTLLERAGANEPARHDRAGK